MLENLEELKAHYWSNNIFIGLVPIILKEHAEAARKVNKKISTHSKSLEFPIGIHDYILGNVILNNCNRSRSGYFHATIR